MTFGFRILIAFAALAALGIAFTFERPNAEAVQSGYRGVGMEQVYNRLALESAVDNNRIPDVIPAVEPAGQPSSAVYQNVQVLGDVDANEFIRLMSAMTEWVSPEQGCAYCHNLENMADDSLYTHRVSRRMLQMTRRINADWKSHVGATGVTCHTCHRGQNVPANIWFTDERRSAEGLVGNPAGQNIAGPKVGYSSLPSDPFTPFMTNQNPAQIRVASTTALPEGNRSSIKQTEWTYGLMIHMSNALGVNCTYCHNSRNFSDWSQSSPARVTSWHGLRMMQDLNQTYLSPLGPVYPAARLGPLGDAPKANCTTCHQGAYKPLLGVSMLTDYPVLAGPTDPTAPPAPAERPPQVAPPSQVTPARQP